MLYMFSFKWKSPILQALLTYFRIMLIYKLKYPYYNIPYHFILDLKYTTINNNKFINIEL